MNCHFCCSNMKVSLLLENTNMGETKNVMSSRQFTVFSPEEWQVVRNICKNTSFLCFQCKMVRSRLDYPEYSFSGWQIHFLNFYNGRYIGIVIRALIWVHDFERLDISELKWNGKISSAALFIDQLVEIIKSGSSNHWKSYHNTLF